MVLSELIDYFIFMSYITLLSPSMHVTSFIYVPIFLSTKVIIEIQIFKLDSMEQLIILLVQSVLMALFPTFIFHLMQKHAINRFYSQIDDDQKEIQVIKFLNSQSNSIILAAKNIRDSDYKIDELGTSTKSKQEHGDVRLLYCNQKSVDLFG